MNKAVLACVAGYLAGSHRGLSLSAPVVQHQYELPRVPHMAYFEHKQFQIVEWQMCQLGQRYYCAVIGGEDQFSAHLKAEGR